MHAAHEVGRQTCCDSKIICGLKFKRGCLIRTWSHMITESVVPTVIAKKLSVAAARSDGCVRCRLVVGRRTSLRRFLELNIANVESYARSSKALRHPEFVTPIGPIGDTAYHCFWGHCIPLAETTTAGAEVAKI